MRYPFLLLALILVLSSTPVYAVDLLMSENGDVADGNDLLKEGKTAEALERYDDAARSLPGRSAVHLNRGLALARSGEQQLDQAMQAFQLASDGTGDDTVRARALHNLANAFYKKQDYSKAVELYKRSLMLAPGNKDVAWNLELARQKKKEQEEQQKKNQENQDQENQENQENQGEQGDQGDQKDQQDQQDQKDQEDKQEDKEEQQDKKEPEEQKEDQKKEEEKQEQQEQQQEQQKPKTKQEVEQVLDSLDDQQKNLQKQMAKQKGAMLPAGRVKDW